MKSLLQTLTDQFAAAYAAVGADPKFGQVVETQRHDLGQFQCNGALAAAKMVRRKPREVAEEAMQKLPDPSLFAKLSIDGPGFVNVTLSDRFLAERANAILGDERFGCERVETPRNVVIDFGGPNVAKPLHVGHLRPHIIGDCIQRLMKFRGDNVTSDVHLGDWGTQMGMLICAVRATKPDLPYFNPDHSGPYPAESPVTVDDLEVMYPAATSLCQQDPEAMARAQQATVELQQGNPGYRALWKHFIRVSVEAVKRVHDLLGVSFDLWLGESDAAPRIPAMIDRLKKTGHAELSEGALVVRVGATETGEEMPPLLLVKSDGGFLYPTTDLATIDQRVQELKADLIAYVVDKRQSLHFKQLFKAARLTGIGGNASFVHIVNGTVNGPDGKPFKTRSGGTMKLEELIGMVRARAREKMLESGIAKDLPPQEQAAITDIVGIAALKYSDLMNFRESDYIFDIDKFVSFEGNTGPYLLYACVRIKSILRKAEEAGVTGGGIVEPVGDSDRQLMLALAMLPDVIQTAYDSYAPHYLCDFLYKLAQAFNQFYRDCHILGEKDAKRQASWLSLVKLCLAEMELVAGILGMKVPERM
jgi:arginyl-tRNA synthetase